MTAAVRPETHPFFVRINHAHHGHTVEAESALDAALLFAERWHAGVDKGDLALIVLDGVTGERHCLKLDLGSGESEPCERPA